MSDRDLDREVKRDMERDDMDKIHERLAEAERLLRLTLKTTLCTYEELDLRDMIDAFLEGK